MKIIKEEIVEKDGKKFKKETYSNGTEVESIYTPPEEINDIGEQIAEEPFNTIEAIKTTDANVLSIMEAQAELYEMNANVQETNLAILDGLASLYETENPTE